eukprot:6258-Heterococcus_DN1.PRE.1
MACFTASTVAAPLDGCEQAAKNVQKATSEVLTARLVSKSSNTRVPALFVVTPHCGRVTWGAVLCA